MDSFEKFNNRELPTKDQFYSILNDEHITDDEYIHAKEVWDTFYIKTMGEYHDLYLVSDVLLQTDVFENFRKTCMQYYKLDPCHYFTSPGLSWDAMLKMTNIKLELMTDIDMFQFIEKGMRGGVSYIANRYGNANNKYIKEYNEKAPSKYIMYLDAINKTNDLILNLTPENVIQHSRIVTTTCKGSSTPTKMSKIIGRQIY